MSNHLMKLVGAVAVVLTLVGCATGVSRQAGSLETPRISTERISQVVIRLSPEAQNKSVDNRGFSSDLSTVNYLDGICRVFDHAA